MLTLVWSEFGRRGEENGSDGTDHGAAGTAFLIGSRARGQMVGEFPGLANGLDDDGNLKPTSDFRGVYCSLLEQWLGADASAVIPGAQRVRAAGARQVKTLGIVAMAFALGYHPTPARLGVSAQEFHLTLSRPAVKAGVRRDRAAERRPGPARPARPPRRRHAHLLDPADAARASTARSSLHVRPGRYRLWCSIADHRALGMQADLRVR